ncbi:hypothetical protein [Candidatus Similichlamydia epinepheli]|uniref:hypothetical protein n=1 Tax=Candidatus Similichlamydia epinepheli TaxID=1903953 RepID=UPI0013007E3C|nr:hypothetical protein [Candidatus Similichlamydia epinepheli]
MAVKNIISGLVETRTLKATHQFFAGVVCLGNAMRVRSVAIKLLIYPVAGFLLLAGFERFFASISELEWATYPFRILEFIDQHSHLYHRWKKIARDFAVFVSAWMALTSIGAIFSNFFGKFRLSSILIMIWNALYFLFDFYRCRFSPEPREGRWKLKHAILILTVLIVFCCKGFWGVNLFPLQQM